MIGRFLEETRDYIRKLDRAKSAEEISAIVIQFTIRFGGDHILAGILPPWPTRQRQRCTYVILSKWPEDWTDRYFSLGYIDHDPAIRRVAVHASSGPSIFLWSDLRLDRHNDPKAWRIMAEASEFKLRQGLTIALTTREGETVGVSIAGEQLEASPEECAATALLASYAIARAIALRTASLSESNISLTVREAETLQWVAAGKSEWEIGQLMNISEHGADKHMLAVRSKLGANTTAQAVGEAVRRGMIS